MYKLETTVKDTDDLFITCDRNRIRRQDELINTKKILKERIMLEVCARMSSALQNAMKKLFMVLGFNTYTK